MDLQGIRDETKFLLGDTGNAVNQLFTDAEYNRQINRAYEFYASIMRQMNSAYFRQDALFNSIEDQVELTVPADCKNIIAFLIDYEGNTIEDDTGGPPIDTLDYGTATELEFVSYDRYLNESAKTDPTPSYTFHDHNTLRFTPKVTTAGTNTIQLVYEAETTPLAADEDEPLLPVEAHMVLAVRAARFMRMSINLDADDFYRDELDMRNTFVKDVKIRTRGKTRQFGTLAFKNRPKRRSLMGQAE